MLLIDLPSKPIVQETVKNGLQNQSRFSGEWNVRFRAIADRPQLTANTKACAWAQAF
jgi:hypothetical protein